MFIVALDRKRETGAKFKLFHSSETKEKVASEDNKFVSSFRKFPFNLLCKLLLSVLKLLRLFFAAFESHENVIKVATDTVSGENRRRTVEGGEKMKIS
jgi:hypothetical protein